MASTLTKAEVLRLFRSLLCTGRQLCDYNMREYTKRRTIDAFRHNKSVSEPSRLSSAYSDGKAQLEVAQRQAIVYKLYAPNLTSIMDLKPIN